MFSFSFKHEVPNSTTKSMKTNKDIAYILKDFLQKDTALETY